MGKYTALIQERRFVTGREMFREVGNRKSVSSLLYNYSRRNSIVRIRRNVYLPTNPSDGFIDENKYEIGCCSVPGAYISYHSAMEFYGLQNQVWHRIYLSSARRFRPFDFEFVEYMYAPEKHREGIVQSAENGNIRVTDPEGTILDCIDRTDLAGGLEELVYNIELLKSVNGEWLLRYLPLYGKSVMYRKTGFILSLFKERLGLGGGFFLTCEKKAGGGVRYLTDKWESETYVPRWKLYVPRYILALTEDCPYPG